MDAEGSRSKYRVVSSETRFRGKIISVSVDEIEFRPGEVADREVIHHGGGVGLVPVGDDGRVILVRQYRHPVGTSMLEIPAGKLGPGEDAVQCAVRELAEETGYTCSEPIKLAEFHPSPGYSNELLHLFIGRDIQRGPRPDRDHEERDLEVVEADLREAIDWISEGRITDGKSIAGLMLAARFLRTGKRLVP